MARATTTPAAIRLPAWLSRERLLVAIVVLVPLAAAFRLPFPTIDIAYLIRAGDSMLRTHELLRTETFTFTAFGDPWLNQQWLAEIVFAAVHRIGGWEAQALLRAALVELTFLLVFLACRARGATVGVATLLTLGALVVSSPMLSPRPQLLGVVSFAVALWLLARRDRHPNGLWALPAVVVVCANVHGSFFLPIMLLAGVWFEDRRREPDLARRELAVLAACVAATFVNPFGAGVWTYVVDVATDPEVRAVSEWLPPSLATSIGIRFALSTIAVAAIVWRARSRVPRSRLVVLVLFAVAAGSSTRSIVWWALAASVLVADLIPPRPARERVPAFVYLFVAAALAGAVAISLPWFRPTYASTAGSLTANDGLLSLAPVAFSDRVREIADPGEHVFVAQAWSSWFELEVPHVRVMVDPRFELFPTSVWNDDDAISSAEDGWEAIVDRWGIDVLVLSELQQAPLIDELSADHAGWDVVARNEDGVVLVRSDEP